MDPCNLLILMSDEHSRRVAGCYGHPLVKTPNIDSIAARGVRFASAYCNSPLCVPSRASFATGRYVHAIGNWDNAAPYTGATPSWGHRLTEQGIPVTAIGKMHFRRVEDDNGFPDERVIMDVKDGIGDLFGLNRQAMPPQDSMVQNIKNAGPGETEYIRFDRAVAAEAARWIRAESGRFGRPWCLWVSFVTPHFPFVVPERYFNSYPPAQVEWPVHAAASEWSRHPYVAQMRRLRLPVRDEELDGESIRRAIAAYYGLVTFMDEQIGVVLEALTEMGLTDATRIMYTSDHGEMLGDFGLWGKSCMYEGSVAVPLILAGPGVPEGRVIDDPTSLVDCFPTIVEAVGGRLNRKEEDLPGLSLWPIASGAIRPARSVFSEYHGLFSPWAQYMLRDRRHKYVYYTGGYAPQLFDLLEDPREEVDLSGDGRYVAVLAGFEAELRKLLNPDEVDLRAKADQRARLDAHGGAEKILAGGAKINYTPAPAEFRQP